MSKQLFAVTLQKTETRSATFDEIIEAVRRGARVVGDVYPVNGAARASPAPTTKMPLFAPPEPVSEPAADDKPKKKMRYAFNIRKKEFGNGYVLLIALLHTAPRTRRELAELFPLYQFRAGTASSEVTKAGHQGWVRQIGRLIYLVPDKIPDIPPHLRMPQP